MKIDVRTAALIGIIYAVIVFALYTPAPPAATLRLMDINGEPFASVEIHGKGTACRVEIKTGLNETHLWLANIYRQSTYVPIDVPIGKSDVTMDFNCFKVSKIPRPDPACSGDRDYNYFCTAFLEENTYYCSFIEEEKEYYHCFAYVLKDPRWCIPISDKYWRSWCVTDCVRNGRCDINACKYATGDFRQVCEGNCMEVQDDLAKTYCEVYASD